MVFLVYILFCGSCIQTVSRNRPNFQHGGGEMRLFHTPEPKRNRHSYDLAQILNIPIIKK